MKKLVIFALVLSIMAVALIGCGTKTQFKGNWNFSQITKVELVPDLEESRIDGLKEQYSAEDEKGIIDAALAAFKADKIFDACYINFDKKYTYTYDPVLDREATWAFYQLGDNAGFISFYTELDVTDSNPDPVLYPDIVYNAETGTMLMTLNYYSFMVTIELTR